MSKLPVAGSRTLHDSPPIKSRKALKDKTEIVNSPHFSKNNCETGIPNPIEIMKARPSRIAIVKDNTGYRAKFKGLSEIANSYNQQSSKFNDLKSKETPYLQRQHNLEERQAKMAEVTREKIIQLNKKLKVTNEKIEELKKQKVRTTKEAIELRKKITDLEVHNINLDRKIEHQKINLENSQKHYEQMFTLQIKERQNQVIRELDEWEFGFEKELKHAQSIDDKETRKDIAFLHEQLKVKEGKLQELFEDNDKKLEKHRERLAEEVKQLIRDEELKNEEFTEVFKEKNEQFDKLSKELDELSKEIQTTEDRIKRIKKEIENENELEETACLTTEDLEKQIQQLMKQSDEMTENLNEVKLQSESINAAYETSKSKIDKERNLRRKIQNTIEELNGKLRVYVRLLSGNPDLSISKEDDAQLELQTVTLNHQIFKFNKVFGPDETEEFIIDETITISENVLKGVNTSFITVGDDWNFFTKMQERILSYLNKRSQIERYESMTFSYAFQVIDLTSDLNSNLTLHHADTGFELKAHSKIIRDFAEWKNVLERKTPNCLTNVVVTGTSEKKLISSNLLILTISSSEMNLFDKLNLGIPTTSSPKNSIKDILQALYNHTKVITMFHIDASNLSSCQSSLQIAKKLNTIDSAKTKKK